MAAARRQASPARAKAAPGPTPRHWGAVAALLAVALVSSLAVIQSTHQCRQLYAQLQKLEATRWFLGEEYSRLLLEQSTWASHYRVEQVAERDMAMAAPAPTEQRVLPR